MRENGQTIEEISVRHQLSALRSLLVLSHLLTTIQDEAQILHLVASAVSSLGRCRTEGIIVNGATYEATVPFGEWPVPVVEQLSSIEASAGARVAFPGRPWVWGFPLSSPAGPIGHLVVGGEVQPTAEETLLLEVLAQQAGAALANARLHARERAQSEELRRANLALERSTTIHQRLTRVAAAGEGQEGIARAVHELTGFPTVIEDRHGNLLAWAGPDQPQPYPKDSAGRRAQLLEIAFNSHQPFSFDGRLVSLARPSSNVVGILALVDPGEAAGEAERMALEHATTVLALELTRLQNLVQSDAQLRAELVIELLAGTKGPGALSRAQTLDYDLGRPHWVVMVEGNHGTEDVDAFAGAVRRVARDTGAGSLLATRPDAVVVLADHEVSWDTFRSAVLGELRGGRCRIGVGGRCDALEDFLVRTTRPNTR